ncbi:MAG: hypothetical protein ABSF25_20800 [Bryobacteraceae bacterium]|jgi:hypothetical protein
MFVIRNTFVAKPGCASKLAAQLKEAIAAFQLPGARVMSDVTGDFNRVIMEHTAESLEEFERRMQETMGSPMYRERMAGYTELWITGSREVLRVV